MLRDWYPVFFGCDVLKSSDDAVGIMDIGLFDLHLGFNNLTFCTGISKAARLQTHESSLTHAMILTAVHMEDGKPVRWRVQNSWGDSAGANGWFVMTDGWFDQFVYQAVGPNFVNQSIRDVLDQEPLVLSTCDPMGVRGLGM